MFYFIADRAGHDPRRPLLAGARPWQGEPNKHTQNRTVVQFQFRLSSGALSARAAPVCVVCMVLPSGVHVSGTRASSPAIAPAPSRGSIGVPRQPSGWRLQSEIERVLIDGMANAPLALRIPVFVRIGEYLADLGCSALWNWFLKYVGETVPAHEDRSAVRSLL
nr:hypothetical protein [Cupriavidus gilardii]